MSFSNSGVFNSNNNHEGEEIEVLIGEQTYERIFDEGTQQEETIDADFVSMVLHS
jgi:hypothetical protein